MKKIFLNIYFLIGLAVVILSMFFCGRSYMEYLLLENNIMQKDAYVLFLTYTTTNPNVLLIIPICTPLINSALTEIELQSKYTLFICGRTSKYQYCLKKAIDCILSGGILVSCAEIFICVYGYIKLQHLTALVEKSDICLLFVKVFGLLIIGFLNGALWAIIGAFSAVAGKNKYLAYTNPFVFYYILTIFQERYYKNFFFLSPRYWVTPAHYGSVFCILSLLALCIVFAECFILVTKRRLDNV